VDHTFKETAKRFGIHHSTVSGWVKESEKQDKATPFGDSAREKGRPEIFLRKETLFYAVRVLV
jgi:transposase